MAGMQTYKGSCHCGAVQFTVEAEITKVMRCNCSICAKAGLALIFVPGERFQLLSGAQSQADYQFHKKRIHHMFCTVCGVRSFSESSKDGKPVYAVNVRALDGVDAEAFPVTFYDGKNL
jgi:hypothetical protein